MTKILLTLSACFVFISGIYSQNERCGTDIMNNRARARNPFLVQAQENYKELMRQELLEFRQNRDGETEAVLVIPMVFHILHMNGPENITDAQIYDQMAVLNRDYNKHNADTIEVVQGFDTIIANVHLEFRLATKDFEGNCTNGIERIYTIETLVGDNGSKLNQWPRDRYLNVWTVANMENGVAGYSQYPSAVIDGLSAKADGVIIRHNYIGRIGTSSEFNSRALTHEIGHYLDLSHTWGDTNDPEVECGDDGVQDTPITEGHSNCLSLTDYSCNSVVIQDYIYHFDDINANTGGTLDPSPTPAGYSPDENFPRLNFSKLSAAGVSANPTADSLFSFSGWGLGGINDSTNYAAMTGALSTADYYQFTITPRPGSAMSLQSFNFHVKRSETGPRNFAVRCDYNNYGTNLPASISPVSPYLTVLSAPNPTNAFYFAEDTSLLVLGAKVSFTNAQLSPAFTNVIEPMTFRIYAWNAEDTDGSFAIDELSFAGTFGEIENVQNYMDYSYCSRMFTEGQKERMRLALAAGISNRNNLYTDENRFLTGTDDNPLTCAPLANFYPENQFVCIGATTTMVDNSTNGVVDSWAWTFEDGNPATSTEQNPTVSFNTYGRKHITLTVTNEQGSTTKTINDCVVVAHDWTEFPGALIHDGFDSQDDFYNQWFGINHDSNMSSWQQTNTAGYSNGTSAKLNAFDMDVTNIDEGGRDIDELISPSMNLNNIDQDAVVTFKWAYATQSGDLAGITDVLEVYISNDCGRTWQSTPRLTLSGLDLVTAGNVSSSFVPTEGNEWSEESFTIPSTFYNSGFRMKFIFSAGDFPNNLYLDDINMSAVLNVETINADFFGARLFPNPANESTSLVYTNKSNAKLNITLTDMSGRVVQSWTPNNSAPGKQLLQINTADLAKGVYMVNLKSDNNTSTLKLMVN